MVAIDIGLEVIAIRLEAMAISYGGSLLVR